MTNQINISFTNENKLKIILDDKLVDPNLKLCFSLVYSIKSISGGEITKQIGRYYELSIKKNTILLDLQIPKIGNFNLSCGPEGIFIIDTLNNSKLNINVSDLIFEINFTTKDTVESDRMNHYYSRYYWDYYMYRDDLYTVTQNILRVNLKDLSQDKTVWTVVTVWRDGSSRSISYDDASNILVDEIMVSFL